MPNPVGALIVSAYLASGIYLTASIDVIGSGKYDYRKTTYSEYLRQRLIPGVTPLKPDSVIAGEPYFVDLSSPAERQRPLAAHFIWINMVVNDEERRIRFVLDKYLSGIDQHNFAVLINDYPKTLIPREQLPIYLHTFDEISRDSDRFIDDLKVRYLVLPAAQRAPRFLSRRWDLIQPGPYWQIWARRL